MSKLQKLFKNGPDSYNLIWVSTDGWSDGKQFLTLVEKEKLDFLLIYVCIAIRNYFYIYLFQDFSHMAKNMRNLAIGHLIHKTDGIGISFSMRALWEEFLANVDTWGKVINEDAIYPQDKMSVQAL